METYIKKYIRSAEDLPQKDNKGESVDSIIVFIGVKDTLVGIARYGYDVKQWFNDRFEAVYPDWYFAPCPELEELVKKQEELLNILVERITNSGWTNESFKRMTDLRKQISELKSKLK